MRWVLVLLSLPLWGGEFLPNRQIPLTNNEANRLFQEQQYEEALKKYLDLYGQDTDNGALAYNLGNTYAAMGNGEKAAEFYGKAVKSEHPEARQRSLFNLGNLQMGQQQAQQAVGNYVNYLRNNPADLDAKRNLELALRMLEQQPPQEQNQENQQDQEDQEQDQSGENQQDEQQNQENQPRNGDEEGGDAQQDDRESSPEGQQQNREQGETAEEDKSQQNQAVEDKNQIDEAVKKQILEALKEQELKQQMEYQRRKTGRTKRRAKDW